MWANDVEAFCAILIYNDSLYNYCNLLLHNSELKLFGGGYNYWNALLTYLLTALTRFVCVTCWIIRTVYLHFKMSLYSVGMQAEKVLLSKYACTLSSVSGRVSSALVCSRAEKAQKSSGSDHTGRDRTACIPAFLQIRPGKADYSDLFPSPFPVWVDGEGGYF